jgi:hypothetical protein
MERGSDKHSPRVDEEMDRETASITRGSPIEARSDEARMKEPPGDGEPMPEQIIEADRS